jgi:DNA polymerase III subunit epsilon
MYAIIDVETTGGKYNQESITDIAIFRFDGKELVDQFISLVNPEKPIQAYVQKLTGIRPEMLRNAPKFYQIAKRVVEITKDAILVGHNIAFDYRMLRLEFERLGYFYESETLDTIHLAERLIPGLEGYGLEKVCHALGINNAGRHRAEGDARATLKLFQILMEKDHEKHVKSQIHKTLKVVEDAFTGNPFEDLLRTYQKSVGIYYLFDDKGQVIYLGRSNNLGNRINKHFLGTSIDAIQLQKAISYVEIDETGSEIVARIKEFVEWNKLQPMFNYGSPNRHLPVMVGINTKGELTISRQQLKKVYNYFNNEKEAVSALAALLNSRNAGMPQLADHALKAKLLAAGIPENGGKPLSDYTLRKWNHLKKDQLYIFRGKDPYEKTFVVVEKGQVCGYGSFELSHQITNEKIWRKAMVEISPHPYINGLLRRAVAEGSAERQVSIAASAQ